MAVRMLPTCRSPLGEGANRTLTPPAAASPGAAPPGTAPSGTAPSGTGPSSVTGSHRVGERSYVLDGHRYLVSVLKRADPRRRPGEQHVAGEQRHHVTGIGHHRRHVVQ